MTKHITPQHPQEGKPVQNLTGHCANAKINLEPKTNPHSPRPDPNASFAEMRRLIDARPNLLHVQPDEFVP